MTERGRIADIVPYSELLAGLAEEASELAHAALKARRALDINVRRCNPTEKTMGECLDHIVEEAADVYLYLEVLSVDHDDLDVQKRMEEKLTRWLRRLNA